MTNVENGLPAAPVNKAHITLFAGSLLEIVDEIEAALAARDNELFQRDGAIYWKSTHGPVKADAALLRFRAMRVANFVKMNIRQCEEDPIDPPLKYFEALLRKGEWKFPRLNGNLRGVDR